MVNTEQCAYLLREPPNALHKILIRGCVIGNHCSYFGYDIETELVVNASNDGIFDVAELQNEHPTAFLQYAVSFANCIL